MVVFRFAAVLVMAAGTAYGQPFFGCVCSTDVPYATGPNNGHKLACRTELLSPDRDTMTLVFQSSQGVNMSVYQGGWRRPVLLYPGTDPAIDYGEDGDRHLVWAGQDSVGGWHVFYRNLEYRMTPLDVGGAPMFGVSTPDVCADDSGLAHVVWIDRLETGCSRICYRACNENGVVGSVFVVAESTMTMHSQVAIEQYAPDNALNVVWCQMCLVPPAYYSIVRRRQVGGVWQPAETLASSSTELGQPSLDFTRNNDAFSAGWYQDVSGNCEVHFEGGNGGGYPTAGASTAPVLVTMDEIWSYLYWQEKDSSGNDICCHFFYGYPPPGSWYLHTTLRTWFGINEDVQAPSCLGAVLVWTQGDSPPYKVMWAYFDYPIGLAEDRRPSAAGGLRVWPNPFRTRTTISLPAGRNQGVKEPRIQVCDASGRCVRSLAAAGSAVWTGTDDNGRPVPGGVYLVRCGSDAARVVKY